MSVHNLTGSRRRLACVAMVALVVTAVAASTVSARTVSGQLSPADKLRAVGTLAHTAAARADTGAHSAVVLGRGQVLGGFTSQGWPVVAQIANNDKRVALVAIGLELRCASGLALAQEDGWTRVPISANGMIRVTRAISVSAGPGDVRGSDSFTGRLDRRRSSLSGEWHLHLDLQGPGGLSDQCDSGEVTFIAVL